VPEYQHLTNDEILHLAEERGQLTEDARLMLEGELHRRKLWSSDIESYSVQRKEVENSEKLKRAVRPYVPNIGLGKRFLGKVNRYRDPSGTFERYDTTLWFVALWFPIFPIATYTVRRDLERWSGLILASNPIAIECHSRNWEQILLTWIKAVLVLWVIVLLLRHPWWPEYLLKRIGRIS
jgi:hypothetical protein